MILVFGKTGQVARELRELIPDGMFLGRDQADLSDPDHCAQIIRDMTPSAVINAAAYTDVDGAEDDEALATQINGAAPGAMATACAALDIPFVHISTDYVFDGSGDAPFAPNATPAPQNAYGRSKLAGEIGVRAAGGRFAILRVSWVFSAHGRNFVKTMLRLGREHETINVVADQIGGPTPARAVADACIAMAQRLIDDPSVAGTYHLSGAPDVSWADFARAIFAQRRMSCSVTNVPSSAYPTRANRPLNSRLDCASTKSVLGLNRPDWAAALPAIFADLEDQS